MDRRLFDYIDKHHVPVFNATVCDGIATDHMRFAEQYIDSIWQCAAADFPEGLRYEGGTRCSPQEEYAVAPAKAKNKRVYEMARSDIYLMKYYLSFEDKNGEREMLRPIYMYLPYVRRGGITTLKGKTFSISPVLADKSISVGVDNLYIPLSRDMLTFKRIVHAYNANDDRVSDYVVWSKIYHMTRKRSTAKMSKVWVDMYSTPVHYMFCKFGLSRTFAEFAGTNVVVDYVGNLTEDKYPAEHWIVTSSTKIRPKSLKTQSQVYHGSDVAIAIKRSDFDHRSRAMIAAFFYIVDHFPGRVKPEYVDDVNMWKILLGKINLPDDYGDGKLINGIDAHLASVGGYVDGLVRDRLREDGIHVNNIYDLFLHIIETMPERLSNVGTEVSSMYGKRLTVLRYVLFDLVKGIFNFMFALKPGTGKIVSKSDVFNALKRHIKMRGIIKLNHLHGEVTSISSPGDNMIHRVTSVVVLQTSTSGKGAKGGKAGKTVGPSKLLHASFAEVGSYTNQPKSAPTGMSRINPCVRIAEDGIIERDPSKKDLIDSVQEGIQR